MKGKGKIVYEAFYAQDLAGGTLPPWDHLAGVICAAFDRAYEAAVQDFLDGISLDIDTSEWKEVRGSNG